MGAQEEEVGRMCILFFVKQQERGIELWRPNGRVRGTKQEDTKGGRGRETKEKQKGMPEVLGRWGVSEGCGKKIQED